LCLVDLEKDIDFLSFVVVAHMVTLSCTILTHHHKSAQKDSFEAHKEGKEAKWESLNTQDEPKDEPGSMNANECP
jgi:hypothetical protein